MLTGHTSLKSSSNSDRGAKLFVPPARGVYFTTQLSAGAVVTFAPGGQELPTPRDRKPDTIVTEPLVSMLERLTGSVLEISTGCRDNQLRGKSMILRNQSVDVTE